MIRKNPKNDLEHPPGQVVFPFEGNAYAPVTYPKPLVEDVSLWKADQYTEQVLAIGYKRGWEAAMKSLKTPLDPSSEGSR